MLLINAAIALTPTAQEDGEEHEAAAEAPEAGKKRGRRRKLPMVPKPQPRYHRKDRRTYVNLGKSHAMAFSKVRHCMDRYICPTSYYHCIFS
jgi:hypothetical protein